MRNRRVRNPYANPSPEQLDYARSLGIDIPIGILRGALSDLIDAALAIRQPTPDQLTFAAALGIEVSEGMTFDEVSDKLDFEIATRSREAMAANPTLRAGKTVMYKGLPYEIWFIGNVKGRYGAELRPVRTFLDRLESARLPKPDGYRCKTVLIITLADSTEVTREALSQFILDYVEPNPE